MKKQQIEIELNKLVKKGYLEKGIKKGEVSYRDSNMEILLKNNSKRG